MEADLLIILSFSMRAITEKDIYRFRIFNKLSKFSTKIKVAKFQRKN